MPAPNGSMYPAELILLCNQVLQAHVKREDDGTIRLFKGDATAGDTGTIITQADIESRIVQAARITFAESGGDPKAICYNYQKPNGDRTCSKVPLPAGTPGTDRGIDRGLWAFNDKSNPDVSPDLAFDPLGSTQAAYRKSNGFTAWGPWSKSAGIDPKADRYDEIKNVVDQAWKEMQGTVTPEELGSAIVPGLAGAVVDGARATANDILDALPDWTKSLGRLLANLIDPAFWRRFGIGILGGAMVLIALVLVVAQAKLA